MDQDPLLQLRDIHLPMSPSWWPPAPGWWVLAVVVIALLAGLGMLIRRIWIHRRPARLAVKMLREIQDRYSMDQDSNRAARELSQLLRRYLLARFPLDRVAGLSGLSWVEFLTGTVGQSKISRSDVERILNDPYKVTPDNLSSWFDLVRQIVDSTTLDIFRAGLHAPIRRAW